jgi:hypothetical protein
VSSSNDWFQVDVYVAWETTKAFLVQFEGGERWFPKSQVYYPRNWHKGYSGLMVVTRWYARTVGLLDNDTYSSFSSSSRPSGQAPSLDLGRSKKIYRDIAQRFHPDRNPQGSVTMMAINELWQAIAADLGLRL